MKDRVSQLTPLKGGMFSRAYAFEISQRQYVLRLNTFEEDFKKDAFAYAHFSRALLPIPKIVSEGKYSPDLYFCVTERCSGKILNDFTEKERRAQLPSLFKTLSVLHRIDVQHYPGYGLMTEQGQGKYSSWETSLLDPCNRKMTYDWEYLWHNSFLDKPLYDHYGREMRSLVRFWSGPKALIHGDFGYDNTLAEGTEITGVIDWAESKLGDPLYDIAWLQFWSDDIEYGKEYFKFCKDQQHPLENYRDRLKCYSLHIGLGSLLIAVHRNDKEEYTKTLTRLSRAEKSI